MPNEIGSTLKKLRENAKITVKEVSEMLSEKGFKASVSTIYSWENDNSQPTPGALLSMCEFYGVPDVLSAFGYDGYDKDGNIQLSMKEIDLIEKYRSLDSYGSDLVDVVLNKEFERCKEEEEFSIPISEEELREFPLDQALKFEPYIDNGMLKVARKRTK